MKKIIAVLLLVCCVLSLSSCGLLIDVVFGAITRVFPDYEEPDAEFHAERVSITLTESFFAYEEYDDHYSFMSANSTTVTVEKYPFVSSIFEEGKSITEYTEQMCLEMERIQEDDDIFKLYDFSEVTTRDGYAYFVCSTFSGVEMKCLFSMFNGGDAIYAVYFICPFFDYETYEPYFLKWADSVRIDNANSQA
ncbi:MAG: hypothetical protein IKC32_02790 [Clostridia bacterium]|nr:hypothetical protein [Clostridia bacterium]